MGGTADHAGCTFAAQQLGPLADRAAGVDHVVDQHGRLAGHIADHREALGHVVAGAALVDDRQRGVIHLLGEGPGPGHAAHVRRHHHHLPQVAGAEVVHQHGRAVDVVAGDVEIALDLGGVQVHGQHPVHAALGEQVGHELGGDRLAAGRLAVGAGIAVVGDHGCHLAGRGPLAGIHHDQQLHQVVVHRSAGWLDQEHVAAADRFLDLDVGLAVGEALDHPRAIGHAQVGADLPGQVLVGGAAEQAQAAGVVAVPCRVLRCVACLGQPVGGEETGHGGRGRVGGLRW